MKNKILSILVTVFLSLVFIGCSEDEDDTNCNSNEIAFVDSLDAPEMGKVNEPVSISVSFFMKNTCGSFESFRESEGEEGLIVEVYASYTGCVCGQAITEDTRVYKFIPTTPGQVRLNFRSGPAEFKSISIEITE